MVVGNESYFVPTAQLPTDEDGFIKKLKVKKVGGSDRRFDAYKLPTFNQIHMETICEIVRKVDDTMDPLLPSDFIMFTPTLETPPAFVTFEEIQVIMNSAGW